MPPRRQSTGEEIVGGPPNAVPATNLKKYKFTYTTGPFPLPSETHSIGWMVVNNDPSMQKFRVTIFRCETGVVKRTEGMGPVEARLQPGETRIDGTLASGGCVYEVQVECNSQLLFPCIVAWGLGIPSTSLAPNNYEALPDSIIKSAEFIQKLP